MSTPTSLPRRQAFIAGAAGAAAATLAALPAVGDAKPAPGRRVGGKIGTEGKGLAAGLLDGPYGRGGCFLIAAVMDRDREPVRGEAGRNGGTDSSASTRDNSNLIFGCFAHG